MDEKIVEAITNSVADAGEKFISVASTTIQNMDGDYWIKIVGAGAALIGIMYIKKRFL
jgi:hypothetical protein